MKISGSSLVLSSEHYFKEMDVSLDEKNEKKTIARSSRLSRNTDNIPGQVFVDRVSLSQRKRFDYQSNYLTGTEGKSTVISTESGDRVEIQKIAAIEKLTGGVIDKKVMINHMERKEDIHLKKDKNNESMIKGGKETQVNTRLIQAREMRVIQTDIHYEEEKLEFSSKGKVTTEDGRQINFSFDISLDKTFLSRTEKQTIIQKWQERVDLTDPLVINLKGTGPELTDVSFEFDLDSDGKKENISFAGGGSGFLVFDKNNDSVINNGTELFGPGTGNGFEELAAFDMDGNNWIDENDTVFSKLSVWTRDENGKDTLISLKDAGIGAISLDYADTFFNMTRSDNRLNGQLKQTGMFLFESGEVGSVHQIDLAVQPLDHIDENEMPATNGSGQLPENVFDESQVSSITGPEVLFPTILTNDLHPEIVNPLQDLLDKLEALKEEMERLFEKMNPASDLNSYIRSRQRHLQGFNYDPSVRLKAFQGPVRIKNRYV